ncbi:hypothetical protein BDU57DRAFT_49079 [Ampelomyces quisqualis]|uniref:Uncharacterized protein n=1 Tax=Ampelomyces quisqualis TaxID=50730 RepID=A0A6A5R2P9_AMPQU|nr:hypothetical protein BDU57DRAFT_49079 [Ampelomyces quisqualis]
MAPCPKPIDSFRITTWDLWTVAENVFKILPLISIIAVAFKTYVMALTRRDTMLVSAVCQEKEDESKATCTIRQKSTLSSQPNDQNARLQALQEELSQPVFKPVHPWVAPPTPLPGPYDAPYYPLPSIRRQSKDSQTPESPPPEEIQTISYTCRISTNSRRSTEADESSLQGTVMLSNHGWRRTQWTVSKG